MLGKHFRPGTDPPEMAGIANSHSRHAVRRGKRGGDLHRLPADDLAKAEITVDDDESTAIADNARVSIWLNLACAEPTYIFRNADHPVRVVAQKTRIDEMGGDYLGLVRIRAGSDEDRLDEIL